MKLRTRFAATIFAAMLGSLAFASSASASSDQIMIREVFLGNAGNDAFIELQMFSPGQTQVADKQVQLYTATGTLIGESTLDGVNADVSNGQSQRTILIGDTAVANRDFTYGPFTESTGGLSAGGAACFEGSNDCVSWGNFTGAGMLPGATGTPVLPAGIPAGASITRKLTRGCRTALDPRDDSNDSASDFAQTNTPSPRGNTAAPTETVCPPCGGRAVTISGTSKKDKIRGTAGKDVIAGLAGNDTIRGRGGGDIICGGRGKDKLIGGGGKDKLFGGPGRDTLRGGGGRDVLRGGPGRDLQIQ